MRKARTMTTIANAITTRKPAPKAFWATMYDQHGAITRHDNGDFVFMADDSTLTVVEMTMFPWIMIHGEIGLCETQKLVDAMHGGYAKIACTRNQEAA